MRCPKCGFISFDYVNNCEKCGRDLTETVALLGLGIVDTADFSWFGLQEAEDTQGIPPVYEAVPEESGAEGEAPGLDLAEIDVSDLISDEYDADALEELDEAVLLDEEVIETVAVDHEFQQALDEVIAE